MAMVRADGAESVEAGVGAVNQGLSLPVDGAAWRRWARRIECALFPPTCVLCGLAARRPDGRGPLDLCRGCHDDLPRNDRCCPVCALPLAATAAACGRCLRRPPPFAGALIPFRYDWPLDGLVTRFKFHADLAAGRVLAEAFLAATAQQTAPLPDAIVPVPLHASRLRRRGYNQSVELANRIGRAMRMTVRCDALSRTRATDAQTGLDAGARRRNVRGAFDAHGDWRGQTIALIDDVVTTGATVVACAAALKRAGASRIVVWAVARAEA